MEEIWTVTSLFFRRVLKVVLTGVLVVFGRYQVDYSRDHEGLYRDHEGLCRDHVGLCRDLVGYKRGLYESVIRTGDPAGFFSAKILNSFGSNPYYPARKTGAEDG